MIRPLALLRNVCGSAFCGVLLLIAVWMLHPVSAAQDWMKPVLLTSTVLLAPLLLLAWSLMAPPRWRVPAFRWVKLGIWLHFVCAAPGVIVLALLVMQVAEPPLPWPWDFLRNYSFMGAVAWAIDTAIIALTPRSTSSAKNLLGFRNTMLLVAAGPLLALWAWSFGHIALVARQAEELAEGRPYCIQVESKSSHGGAGGRLDRYRSVADLYDLSGLRMWASTFAGSGSTDFQFAFHGLLAVEGESGYEYWNWSHSSHAFTRVSENARQHLHLLPVPFCQPRVGFWSSLPLFAA